MTDCAVMGADWTSLTWWQYQALLNRWNARSGPAEPAPVDVMRARQVLELHTVQ